MQREVFGKTREEIVAVLTKSREQMLEGFKALIEGRMPEPLNRLADITTHGRINDDTIFVPPPQPPPPVAPKPPHVVIQHHSHLENLIVGGEKKKRTAGSA